MELANCKNCGVPFLKRDTTEICFECLKREMNDIKKINQFIETTRVGCFSLKIISENTGIDLVQLEKLYKKGALLSITDKLEIQCKFCGMELRGKDNKIDVCPQCSKEMVTKIKVEKALIVKETAEKINRPYSNKQESQSNKQTKYGFKKKYD